MTRKNIKTVLAEQLRRLEWRAIEENRVEELKTLTSAMCELASTLNGLMDAQYDPDDVE